jgi:hypothetical protein
MKLAEGRTEEDLRAALENFAASSAPVALGQLQIADLAGFLALVPQGENTALQDFAAHVVEQFEPFRAPLDPRSHAARAKGLNERQLELLGAYGYPYVFDQFRFHMTLTDRLVPEDQHDLRVAAQTWFGPVLDADINLDRLVLYHEPESGLPFPPHCRFCPQGMNQLTETVFHNARIVLGRRDHRRLRAGAGRTDRLRRCGRIAERRGYGRRLSDPRPHRIAYRSPGKPLPATARRVLGPSGGVACP